MTLLKSSAFLLASVFLFCCQSLLIAEQELEITNETFGCIRNMEKVRNMYVANLTGDLDATTAVANSSDGGKYPAGSLIQLVPTEAMVKHNKGYNPLTNDWEFFELDVSKQGSSIKKRGFSDVVNRFGGNCFACHIKAKPEWDMICETGHGCDPLPLTKDMFSVIQKTDPRCAVNEELTENEMLAAAQLQKMMAPPEKIKNYALNITQRPIIFDETRERLSLEYLSKRYNLKQLKPTITPKMVVVHWTVIPTLEKSFNAFNPAELPASRDKIGAASSLNVSAHYLIDRDGTIYQLLPNTTFARHVIGLNHSAIGIENVGDNASLPLTPEQLQANIDLISKLSAEFPIEYVIGHYEYTNFIGHPLWKETDPTYLTEKTDPGVEFITAIRKALSHLPLKEMPKPVNLKNKDLINEQ